MSCGVRQSWGALLMLASLGMLGACSDQDTNEAPTAAGPSVVTDEDTPVLIDALQHASDPDGDELSVVRATAPGHTAVVVSASTIRVVPKKDFHGTLQVEYLVTDGNIEHSTTAWSTVTVRPVNDAPVPTGSSKAVRGKSAVVLEAIDPDGDPLTYEVTTGPAHGTLAGNAPMLEYTPQAKYEGADAIGYRVSDGKLTVDGTLALQVRLDSPPSALDRTALVFEDTIAFITLQGSDADGDRVTFTVTAPPAHGTLTGAPPTLIYTPDKDFAGEDSLMFTASAGGLTSSPAKITLNVNGVDDPPVAKPASLVVTEDVAQAVTLAGTDIDNTVLSFQIREFPKHGTLTGSGANRTYVPVANYHGPDSFTFEVHAGFASSAPATVTIDVQSVEDTPIAESFAATVIEDTPGAITLRGRDGDGDALTFAIAANPTHGTLTGAPPAMVYTPEANYSGPDSFTYTATSGTATSEVGTVTLQVSPRNDPPTAENVAVTTAEDTAVAITLVGKDIDGDALIVSVASLPLDGTLNTVSGPNLTYTPAPNASGTRAFTYRVFDGSVFATATVTIEITPVNDPPTTRDDFVMADLGAPLTVDVTANDLDPEGDSFQLDSVDAPAHGDVEIVDGKLVFTPADGFTGTDVFAYTVIDAHGDASQGFAHVGVGAFPPGAPTEAIAIVAGSTTVERAPAISSDGRFLAFSSFLPLVPEDTNGLEDVYLFDRNSRQLARVSISPGGEQSNGPSQRPHLSASGRYVVFESTASNLVDGDTNGVADVFRHDRMTGELVRVSVATGGGQASGQSIDPEISEDGGLVVFTSSAFDLIADDANGAPDIFVRDLTAGTTTRISVSTSGGDADLESEDPTISGDGRFVAFSSRGTNLVPGDTNNVQDVFVRDRVAGTTTRVSISSTGGEANQLSRRPSLSRDGRFVSFVSSATNLVTGAVTAFSGSQLFVRDTQAQTTTWPVRVSSTSWGRLSGDGRYVVIFGSGGAIVRDRFAAVTATLPDGGSLSWPMISANGRYIVALDSFRGIVIEVMANPL